MDLLQVISLYTLPIFINSLENLLCIYTYIYLSKYLYVYIYILYGELFKTKVGSNPKQIPQGHQNPHGFPGATASKDVPLHLWEARAQFLPLVHWEALGEPACSGEQWGDPMERWGYHWVHHLINYWSMTLNCNFAIGMLNYWDDQFNEWDSYDLWSIIGMIGFTIMINNFQVPQLSNMLGTFGHHITVM